MFLDFLQIFVFTVKPQNNLKLSASTKLSCLTNTKQQEHYVLASLHLLLKINGEWAFAVLPGDRGGQNHLFLIIL